MTGWPAWKTRTGKSATDADNGIASRKDITRRVPLDTDGKSRKKHGLMEWTTPKRSKMDFTSSSGTSNGRSRTKTKRILWSAAVTGIGTSPKRKVDPSRRLSRYSAVLQVTRTQPLLRNCTASIFSASRALSNCGATSDIPRFFWISNGKCNTKSHICKTNSKTIQNVLHYLPEKRQVSLLFLRRMAGPPVGSAMPARHCTHIALRGVLKHAKLAV